MFCASESALMRYRKNVDGLGEGTHWSRKVTPFFTDDLSIRKCNFGLHGIVEEPYHHVLEERTTGTV